MHYKARDPYVPVCHKMFTFSVFLVFLACGYVDSLSVKVLKPPPAKQGLEGALLIAPGAFIKGEAYEPLGKSR